MVTMVTDPIADMLTRIRNARPGGAEAQSGWRDRLRGVVMSRIGNKPIDLPDGVDVKIDGTTVKVKGSKGELERSFNERIGFDLDEGVLTVTRPDDARETVLERERLKVVVGTV